MERTDTVRLSGVDLFSKWGFEDGDLLYRIADECWFPPDDRNAIATAGHDLLILLAQTFLKAKIEEVTGLQVGLVEIGTSHNPIRCDEINRYPTGVWTEASDYHNPMVPRWQEAVSDVHVDIPLYVLAPLAQWVNEMNEKK